MAEGVVSAAQNRDRSKKEPNRKALTQAVVDRTSPPVEGSITIWDTLLPSFGLRISFKGRRTWTVKYRVNSEASHHRCWPL